MPTGSTPACFQNRRSSLAIVASRRWAEIASSGTQVSRPPADVASWRNTFPSASSTVIEAAWRGSRRARGNDPACTAIHQASGGTAIAAATAIAARRSDRRRRRKNATRRTRYSLTTNVPGAARAAISGWYISSADVPGTTNVPAVVARAR